MKPLNCLSSHSPLPLQPKSRRTHQIKHIKTSTHRLYVHVIEHTVLAPLAILAMASRGVPDGRKASTAARPPPEQGLRCPRCDSPNTKFCYYNNYSLSQPRHFCKACRRYWTKGGALRNVPVGGGCRKNKKAKAAASAAGAAAGADDYDGGAGLRFLHGGPVELQLSGLPFSRLNSPSNVYNQFFTFGDLSSSMIGPSSSSCGSTLESAATGAIGNSPSTLLSFRPCPMSSPILRQGEGIIGHGVAYGGGSIQDQMGSRHVNMQQINSIASSIESLSSMNQDLHLKLQQQRFAMLFGGSHRDQNSAVSSLSPSMAETQQNHHLPISFQTSGSSKINGDHIPAGNRTMVTATDNLVESSSQEMQTWSDMHQYS